MTTAADDAAVEDAFEAILAKRPTPDGQAGLAAFTEAVRSSATRPGRPHAALAELLSTGLLTDQSSPSVRTARSAGSPPARRPSRVRTRRRTAMILPALIAKFLSAGAVAQAATGAGVVVVAFTGVGAVGALPAPAQDSFSTVVAAVTPLTPPTSEEIAEEPAEDAVPEETLTEDSGTAEDGTVDEPVEPETTEAEEFDVAAWAVTGPEGYDSHGAWVTASAQNPELRAALKAKGVSFGAVISGWANGNGVDPDVLAALGFEKDEPADVPAAEQPVEVAPVVEPTDGGGGSAAVVTESGARGNSSKAQAGPAKQGQAKSQGAAQGNGGGNGRGNG